MLIFTNQLILFIKNLSRDEYKEFEKLIQEDLKEVDNRLEEEEVLINIFVINIKYSFVSLFHLPAILMFKFVMIIMQYDAAEMIEEAETVEQK